LSASQKGFNLSENLDLRKEGASASDGAGGVTHGSKGGPAVGRG